MLQLNTKEMDKIYIEDLNQMQCSDPNCTHDHKEGLVLNSACHIGAPTTVMYRKGVLEIKCAVCDQKIADIAVASKITQN